MSTGSLKTILSQLIAVSVLTLTTATLIHAADETPPKETKAALTVNTVSPQIEKWDTQITATGAIAAWQEASISSEIGGLKIIELNADVGDKVKRGQVIARLASDAIEAEIAQQNAAVAQAKANLADAQANAARADKLRASGALPAQQLDQYATGAKVAEANLEAALAGLESHKIRLNHTTITAIDNGTITSRTSTLGAVVQAGTELFKVLRQNRLDWLAEVPAQYLNAIEVGQPATINLPTGTTISGEIRKISPTLNNNTRTTVLYVALPTDSSARMGMFAQGQIQIGEAQALTIPQGALIIRDGNNYVFVLNKDNTVQQRLVKTGRRQNDRVEIMEGITADNVLVATGGAFLNDGDRIKVATGTQP